MGSEAVKIIIRRFMDRFLESGLLVLAVSLGIGAASSGIALLANTVTTSRSILESPAYRELIVSTVGSAEDMELPVSLKAVKETAVVSAADLEAGNLVPGVSHSYVQQNTRMRFINAESVKRESEMEARFGTGDNDDDPPGRGQEYSSEDLDSMAGDQNLIISGLEEVNGYEVTPDFFEAWNIQALTGSLFSLNDMTGSSNIALLSLDLAAEFLREGESLESLTGKQLLTRDGLVTIIGVFEDAGERKIFYSPYRSRGTADHRQMYMNTELRFTVDDPELLGETAARLQQWFDSRFGEQQVVISNPRAQAEQLISRNTGLSLLILFLSLSGLFIASVNVSNILMSRGMRMKKHIGILMALGSSRQAVSRLFIWESAAITVMGACLGTLMSLPLGRYMQSSLEISGGNGWFTLLGVLLSGALTLLFGLLPARQYAKIDPALAMRSA